MKWTLMKKNHLSWLHHKNQKNQILNKKQKKRKISEEENTHSKKQKIQNSDDDSENEEEEIFDQLNNVEPRNALKPSKNTQDVIINNHDPNNNSEISSNKKKDLPKKEKNKRNHNDNEFEHRHTSEDPKTQKTLELEIKKLNGIIIQKDEELQNAYAKIEYLEKKLKKLSLVQMQNKN